MNKYMKQTVGLTLIDQSSDDFEYRNIRVLEPMTRIKGSLIQKIQSDTEESANELATSASVNESAAKTALRARRNISKLVFTSGPSQILQSSQIHSQGYVEGVYHATESPGMLRNQSLSSVESSGAPSKDKLHICRFIFDNSFSPLTITGQILVNGLLMT